MSLKSWMEEFYPIPASQVEKKDALRHSLRKWEGLRKKNRDKHGLVLEYGYNLCENGEISGFEINDTSCALCHFYQDENEIFPSCNGCPLAIARNRVRCDNRRSREHQAPYAHFIENGNPEPMIRWLKLSTKGRKGRK